MDKEVKKSKKTVGEGVGFERIRRITGYLVGTLDRFNNAKKAEVKALADKCLTEELDKVEDDDEA